MINNNKMAIFSHDLKNLIIIPTSRTLTGGDIVVVGFSYFGVDNWARSAPAKAPEHGWKRCSNLSIDF